MEFQINDTKFSKYAPVLHGTSFQRIFLVVVYLKFECNWMSSILHGSPTLNHICVRPLPSPSPASPASLPCWFSLKGTPSINLRYLISGSASREPDLKPSLPLSAVLGGQGRPSTFPREHLSLAQSRHWLGRPFQGDSLADPGGSHGP